MQTSFPFSYGESLRKSFILIVQSHILSIEIYIIIKYNKESSRFRCPIITKYIIMHKRTLSLTNDYAYIQ